MMQREIKFRVWNKATKEMFVHFEGARVDLALTYYELNIKVSEPMQFTGLKDKNDVEIYEGDILKPKSYHPTSPIFFMNGSWKVQGKHSKIGVGSWANLTEIIGNIHENPELLKQ